MQTNPPDGEITRLLKQWGMGDIGALDQLIPIVYGELKNLAGHYLRMERPGHTLQCTALVHEVYVRLSRQGVMCWEDRRHFFAVASRIIRHLLVDHARRHAAAKRGRDKRPLEEALTIPVGPDLDLVALDLALESLGRTDPEKLRVVELRFFGGLSVEETAEVMGASTATVKRAWSVARLRLYKQLYGGG
jgi:RNA polymerase sigma factor (TIGR02999 family)